MKTKDKGNDWSAFSGIQTEVRVLSALKIALITLGMRYNR